MRDAALILGVVGGIAGKVGSPACVVAAPASR
jgi:hypothetical protein